MKTLLIYLTLSVNAYCFEIDFNMPEAKTLLSQKCLDQKCSLKLSNRVETGSYVELGGEDKLLIYSDNSGKLSFKNWDRLGDLLVLLSPYSVSLREAKEKFKTISSIDSKRFNRFNISKVKNKKTNKSDPCEDQISIKLSSTIFTSSGIKKECMK